jgi:hypothetical protein
MVHYSSRSDALRNSTPNRPDNVNNGIIIAQDMQFWLCRFAKMVKNGLSSVNKEEPYFRGRLI